MSQFLFITNKSCYQIFETNQDIPACSQLMDDIYTNICQIFKVEILVKEYTIKVQLDFGHNLMLPQQVVGEEILFLI